MLEKRRFAFMGGGNMAEALLKGLLSGLGVAPGCIIATDILPERRDYLKATYGISTSTDNPQAVRDSDIIILAVKPKSCRKSSTSLPLL